ncbi:MAG: hypothetical protein WA941_09335 [Nitrososphaeraceae archaeon]
MTMRRVKHETGDYTYVTEIGKSTKLDINISNNNELSSPSYLSDYIINRKKVWKPFH